MAAPHQENSQAPSQQRISPQQTSMPTASEANPTPTRQTHAVEEALTSGVDIAEIEAELDSFADTFAIQPDEALLHAYATLLADKVAEAGSDSAEDVNEDCTQETQQAADPDKAGAQTKHISAADAQRGMCAVTACEAEAADAKPDGLAVGASTWHADSMPGIYSEAPDSAAADSTAADSATAQMTSRDAARNELPNTAGMATISPITGAATCEDAHGAQLKQQPSGPSPCESGDAGQASAARTNTAGATWHRKLHTWRQCWVWVRGHSRIWHVLMGFCFGAQLIMAAYFGLVHQRYTTVVSAQPPLCLYATHSSQGLLCNMN